MRILKFLTILLVGWFLFLEPVFSVEPWQELKGEHFIIFYVNDESFAKDVLRSAEGYYRGIGDDLGYTRHSDFWKWDKRVKIYIHATQEQFLKETGHNNWSHGFADYMLYVDGRAAGVIEAKKEGVTLTGVEKSASAENSIET